jgi:hypothetical protein
LGDPRRHDNKTDEDFLFAASPPYEMTSRDLID